MILEGHLSPQFSTVAQDKKYLNIEDCTGGASSTWREHVVCTEGDCTVESSQHHAFRVQQKTSQDRTRRGGEAQLANFVEAPILAAFLLCCRSEKVGRFVPFTRTSHHQPPLRGSNSYSGSRSPCLSHHSLICDTGLVIAASSQRLFLTQSHTHTHTLPLSLSLSLSLSLPVSAAASTLSPHTHPPTRKDRGSCM